MYDNSIHTATKLTPLSALFGFQFEMPTNLKRQTVPLYNSDDYPSQLKYQLARAHKLANENLRKAKIKSKDSYDRRTKCISFQVGQRVLVRNPARKNKFAVVWTGPFEVVSIEGPVTTAVKIHKSVKKIHNNRLKLYY